MRIEGGRCRKHFVGFRERWRKIRSPDITLSLGRVEWPAGGGKGVRWTVRSIGRARGGSVNFVGGGADSLCFVLPVIDDGAPVVVLLLGDGSLSLLNE